MDENRNQLINVLLRQMTKEELKEWIYGHTEAEQLMQLLIQMPDEEIENELNQLNK